MKSKNEEMNKDSVIAALSWFTKCNRGGGGVETDLPKAPSRTL